MNQKRVTYEEMRHWVLDSFYNYCRTKLRHRSKWAENESELGYAYEQFESTFEHPIERLMLEVLMLVLDAARGPVQFEQFHREAISKLLAKNDLEGMLKELEGEEAREFRHDLELLSLAPSERPMS